MIFQIILIIFFILALVKVFLKYRSGDLNLSGTVYWTVFWIAAGFIVLLPDASFFLARFAGIGRGADFIVYVSLAALFFLIFKMMIRIERLNKDVTKLTRKITLSEGNKEIEKL